MTDRTLVIEGVQLPSFLYGTAWKEDPTQPLTELVLRQGFRGIDTANQRRHYHEAAVGQAVAASIASGLVARDGWFLQTKFTFRSAWRRGIRAALLRPGRRFMQFGFLACGLLALVGKAASAEGPLDFTIKIETVQEHDDGKFLWFHPRVAAVPGDGRAGVVMTLQKHLRTSDHYSGLYFMRSDDLGATWTKPALPPGLDWRRESDKVDVAVADVTPGWHAPTGKVLAVGAEVRYSKKGQQLDDKPRSHQTAYAVYDPKAAKWAGWERLEMPKDDQWNFARSACAQWLVKRDGTLLLPFYFGRDAATKQASVTVVQCSFDGREVKYLRHGTELALDVDRGLVEPSLVAFGGRYYLTIRNDRKGYVTSSADGLHFGPIKPWTFDDGKDLGSYNTQQHWLAHSGGLFLVYTRRGADNDHILRHRAPLFIARVDPKKLHVLRATERVLIPERGATLGNFGAAAVTANESWVTVSEGVWDDAARRRGAKGATFVARVQWSRPNRLVSGLK